MLDLMISLSGLNGHHLGYILLVPGVKHDGGYYRSDRAVQHEMNISIQKKKKGT